MKNRPSVTPATMPPSTPVPIARCAPEPAPVAMASGSTPKPNASEVIRIGRNRIRTACIVASTSSMPCSRLRLANSMIRIEFLLVRPTVVSIATWKYTSRFMPNKVLARVAPRMPRGATISTAVGMDQLSYNAARHRKTIRSDSA